MAKHRAIADYRMSERERGGEAWRISKQRETTGRKTHETDKRDGRQDEERDDNGENRMRRYENAGSWQASRQGTRRKTRRTNETRNETGTTPPARIDSGVVAISFFMRRSHQLIHIIRRPVFSSRLSFRSAPRSLAPPGSPVPRPVLRPVATPRFSSRHLVISSSHPVISFAYRFLSSYRIGLVPFTAAKRRRWWRATGTEAGGFFFVRRFPQLIIVRPVIRFSPSGTASDRCGLDGCGLDDGPSSSHPVHLTHSPLPSSHHGTRGGLGRPSSVKQATASWHPSHHGGPGSSSLVVIS